jgi:hypothetical protein
MLRMAEVDEVIELAHLAAEPTPPGLGRPRQLGHERTAGGAPPDLEVAVLHQQPQALAHAHPRHPEQRCELTLGRKPVAGPVLTDVDAVAKVPGYGDARADCGNRTRHGATLVA